MVLAWRPRPNLPQIRSRSTDQCPLGHAITYMAHPCQRHHDKADRSHPGRPRVGVTTRHMQPMGSSHADRVNSADRWRLSTAAADVLLEPWFERCAPDLFIDVIPFGPSGDQPLPILRRPSKGPRGQAQGPGPRAGPNAFEEMRWRTPCLIN